MMGSELAAPLPRNCGIIRYITARTTYNSRRKGSPQSIDISNLAKRSIMMRVNTQKCAALANNS
jgi:hypothetical protein